jgi:hypothetical protein
MDMDRDIDVYMSMDIDHEYTVDKDTAAGTEKDMHSQRFGCQKLDIGTIL